MTVFATWCKAVIPALLLAGCSSFAGPHANSPSSLPPAPVALGPRPASQGHLAGLKALPTPAQVEASVPIGRRDPFAPIAASGRQANAQAALPAGFRFSGVVRSGGQVQALVQFGNLSGTLSAGQQGGRSTDLLPPGWKVARVDGQRGRLLLLNGGQSVVAEL
ncbi:hypothetical protein KBY58_10835 [Cyanobium sp. HWJ4-Hawea]|uniref:hypothetical protein n=1 Tax=Cyanobium sp. HWJ4-Hawea TaxID=2823713 RepID=UPI0020CCBA0F|nr:hypothetical protein [Cyanobium sp. HWJ4-Hawea]MCP9809929.1 hypothetical protein [Cyanobium sp. HWJ4-Hawea]